jgi:hypothetical protein
MLELPEFSSDRILRRCVLWILILGFIAAGYFAYRHEHNRAKAAPRSQTGLKTVVDPESVMKDF